MSHGSVSTRDAESAADSFTREARIGARFGWISTAAWIVLGMDSILRPSQDNRRDVFWWFPFAFMMLTIVAVHRVQRWRGLRVERYTYYSVMFASALALLDNLGLVFNMPLLPEQVPPAFLGFLLHGESDRCRMGHTSTCARDRDRAGSPRGPPVHGDRHGRRARARRRNRARTEAYGHARSLAAGRQANC